MFTGDVMQNQVPQTVFFPPLLLAPTTQVISVNQIEQQLLHFMSNGALELLKPMDPDTPGELKEKFRI
jgi:hypothetical protein